MINVASEQQDRVVQEQDVVTETHNRFGHQLVRAISKLCVRP
jgi:hypothetical protein